LNGQLIRIVRADDLLVCELELDGLAVSGVSPNRELVRAVGPEAHVIVHFPPQHITEEAFPEPRLMFAGVAFDAAVGDAKEGGLLVPSRAAGPSRVSFVVPDSLLPVPYRLEPILELLKRCTLSVGESAKEAPDLGDPAQWIAGLVYYLNPPLLAAPEPTQTAIELPFRLILSPNEAAGFSHEVSPATDGAGTRTELWHSRLALEPGKEGGEQDAASRPLRAIWMRQGDGEAWSPTQPGIPSDDTEDPFRLNALKQRHRAAIVHLSANRAFRKQTGADFDPTPVETRRLALSSVGAWLTSRGQWDSPALIRLIEWSHRATQGRDQFVRVVDQGFAFPFRHLTALITVTERHFVPELPENPGVLLQRKYVLVRQPIRDYPPGAAPQGLWFTMPLSSIEIRTLLTPDLDVPADSEECFLIRAQGSDNPFLFKLRGIDVNGNAIDLASPLVFISSDRAWDKTTLEKAQGLYDGVPEHVLDAGGANVALAPGPAGDTTFPTTQLTFTAKPQPQASVPLPPADKEPGFWPELHSAKVRAPALEILTGEKGDASVSYHDLYRSDGFGGDNRSEVFAQLDAPLSLDYGNKGDRAGALMQPSMGVQGLSRQLGAVGGTAAMLGDVGRGTFKPEDFFAGMDAKLFGVLPLDHVLAAITGAHTGDMPRTVTQGGGNALTAQQVWTPTPQSYPAKDPVFVVKPGSTKVQLTATVEAKGGQPTSEIEAWITNFELHLLGGATFIEVAFDRIEFTAHAGKKADVDVKIGAVRFVGPLSFVERLREIIPLDGFSDPPALTVDADGIHSNFSLAVPEFAVGVFALQNLKLGAGFSIPFRKGPLTVLFNFCERQEPFLLTVSLFGGGGFFALAVDPNGVQRLEAALEFGATAAIDLGVAQGGVHVMAGVYFKIETDKGATLSGYFRLGGNMSVLGLISASIELYLSLTYQDPGKALGRATLTVEIDIFLFSMSVEVTCERKFAGSASDPTFHDLMQRYPNPEVAGTFIRPWHDYCNAYA
jgi:hypothetical protein